MKAASLVGYFGAGSGWLKVAAEKAEAERMRKALVCLKAAALVKEPYSPVLLASMSFHCRTFAGPKPQVNYSQKLNMAPAENWSTMHPLVCIVVAPPRRWLCRR